MADNAKAMEEMEQKWADRLEEAERKNKVWSAGIVMPCLAIFFDVNCMKASTTQKNK